MGIFKRISMVIRSFVNRLLDRVEDPEKILDQALNEMEENFRRSKVDLARTIADEKRLKKQLDQNRDQAEQWSAKAVLAVKKGDDNLAREALKRKNSYEVLTKEIEEHWRTQKDITDQLKDSLRQLQMKIDEAKRKRNLLVTRRQRALLQKKVYESLKSASGSNPASTFNKLEEKISSLEAESAALESLEQDTLEEKFKALSATSNVENQLSDLKKKFLPEDK